MKTKILCTLGPSSMNDRVIARLEEVGVSLFRLNLSHIQAEDVRRIIEYLQSRCSVDICLDTEGAQIRTGYMVEDDVVVRENSTIRVPRSPVPGDPHGFNLYPGDVLDMFVVGDFITIDSTVLCQVVDIEPEQLLLRVLTGGRVGRNKAATLERQIEMPPLTHKDRQALEIGKEMGIRNVALSFAHRASDVDEIRAASLPGAFVISKIECLEGLANLEEIARGSDALLIDRGDLSRQVPLEKIPLVQKQIIRTGSQEGVPVYVATNLMESMTTQPEPTRAEVNDVFNTLLDGADGLVLAAETAIGRYPIGCANMIKKLAQAFEQSVGQDPLGVLSRPVSLLVEPHGGKLVERRLDSGEIADLEGLPTLMLGRRDLLDCEQIAVGTYSPLTGFMDRTTLESVLESHRLPGGPVWPMPIVLRVSLAQADPLRVGGRVKLCDGSGTAHALMDVTEIFPFDFAAGAERWFGEDAEVDPRIASLLDPGGVLVAGDVTLLKRPPAPEHQYQLTPQETRYVFTKKGWNRVIAFHTHTAPHRAHEEVQRAVLESTHADGLYVSVETGAVEAGDFLPGLVLRSYQLLLDFGFYPRGKILLGASSSFSRGVGARESVFLAICRKNMGFSHIFMACGEAEAGTRALFESLGDLGIEPVFVDPLGYDPDSESFQPQGQPGTLPINGSLMRKAFQEGERLPGWFVQSIVRDSIQAEVAAGRPVFHGERGTEGDSNG